MQRTGHKVTHRMCSLKKWKEGMKVYYITLQHAGHDRHAAAKPLEKRPSARNEENKRIFKVLALYMRRWLLMLASCDTCHERTAAAARNL